MEGPLPAVTGEDAAWLTSTVVPETRSWRKRSVPSFVSTCPGTRLVALLWKAMKRPSALKPRPGRVMPAAVTAEAAVRLARVTAPVMRLKTKRS